MSRHILIIFALFICALGCASAYKYLIICPSSARSHYTVGIALAKGLAAAGHQVTIVSAFPLKKPIENITDVPAEGIIAATQIDKKNLLEFFQKSVIEKTMQFRILSEKMTTSLMEEPNVQKLLNGNEHFDAVICEVFLNEAHFGFAEHFNAPLIALSTFGAITWNTELVGSPSPPSYVPHVMLQYSDRMTLWERIGNLAFYTYEYIDYHFFFLPTHEEYYKRYFPKNKRSLAEIRKNTALVLLNQHASLSFPRPYSPNMIEVGGMHINRKRMPLSANIEKFINESKHGVIYFSMGSNLKSTFLPLEKREVLLNTFRGIKQRVLWKFEDKNLPNKPHNVYVSDWFPQDDILAHENVIAFITHGGLLSTTEAIYHGTPFVGMPMYGDQFVNMARAEQNGYGIMVRYDELSVETFKGAIERITSDPKYTKLIREMSGRFRDQLETPLERAVYWVEHVTRHKGASYLRSASQDLNFVQYHNLDAVFLLFGGIFSLLFVIVYILTILGMKLKKKIKVKKN